MTTEITLQMLKDEEVEVTLEQAGMILEFLRKLANMTVYNYLNKKDEKNSRPESEYRLTGRLWLLTKKSGRNASQVF